VAETQTQQDQQQTDRVARAQRVTDIAEKYPDAFLACRDFGHSWRPLTASWNADNTITRRLRCVRCSVERHQLLTSEGYIVSGGYSYADGYQIKGVGSLTTDDRAVLRKTNVLRGLER
jgi:hypothetical protein